MANRCLQLSLLILPLVLTIAGSASRATASSSDISPSYSEQREVAQELDPNSADEVSEQEKDSSQSQPISPQLCPIPEPPLPIPEPLAATSEPISVRQINVTGSTIFGSDEINSIVESFEGQELSPAQLQAVADAITGLYVENGYITSRAVIVGPEIIDGVVEIRVIEGHLVRIEVEGTQRLNPSYICSRIGLAAKPPFSAARLEEQLKLLRFDPLFANLDASLLAAGEVGQSILKVRVQEANRFVSSFGVDNYSPPSVGSERLGAEVLYRNVTGIGDEIGAAYHFTTTDGADVFDFTYRVPLNAMNGTLQLRAAPNRSEITQPPFDELDIRGENDLYEIVYRQPLVRTLRKEFALSLGFTYQDGQTFIFNELPTPFGIGPDDEGVSRTSVIRFGQDYVSRGAQGTWFLRSQFSLGTGLFDASTNEAPIPDGQFVSWLGQVQRVQRLSDDHLLIVQADLQLTPDSLLPSQQFIIGGGHSVRGYRQNARSGDNGFRFSMEDRIALDRDEGGIPVFQLAPFLDIGAVWNFADNPNELPDQTFLISTGLGLIWDSFGGIKGLSLRLDYGIPFIDLDDRGRNIQDQGFYFSLIYQP